MIVSNDIAADATRRLAAIDDATQSAARTHNAAAKRVVAVDTGRLRSSLDVMARARYEWISYTQVKYAVFVEYGTRAHTIRPRRAKALRWYVGGTPVFATEVHHPGTPPQPFMGAAYESTLSEVLHRFRRAA